MRLRFSVLCLAGCAAVGVCLLRPAAFGADAPASPMLAALARFVTPGIPRSGPAEGDPAPINWAVPDLLPQRPGRGLAEHPMLYVGEGHNTIYLVNGGRVVWTYSTGPGGEIDDVWMLSNGNVLFARQFHVEEVTPNKDVVWHYNPPAKTEVHTCQPLGLDKVMVVQNGLPPKLLIFNTRSGEIEVEHTLPADSFTDNKTVHTQFRRGRATAAGTYLLAFLRMNKVVEFDRDFNVIWTYDIPSPWSAIRLQNGNTLITDEKEKLVREVGPKGETVWEFKQSDLPADIVLHNVQTADRLANGNTVIFSSTGGVKTKDFPGIIQAVEVTPDKKVVWVLQDWKNLGPATTAQFLDQPAIPEKAGDLQH